jgi:hypothetical protein
MAGSPALASEFGETIRRDVEDLGRAESGRRACGALLALGFDVERGMPRRNGRSTGVVHLKLIQSTRVQPTVRAQ